jgi:serine/threonine protein kinase
VLLTDIGRIKISDFGSSIDLTKNNAIEQKRPDANEINSSTASGVTTNSISRMMTIPLGTAAYAAPELNRQQYQSLDRPHDKNGGNDATDVHTAPTAAVDLWSLGCVLYACLMEDSFHQSPFDKGSEAASLEAQKDYCDIMDTSKRYDVLFGKNPINLPDITESKNDISAKNRESLQELKHLIAELLNPIAEERIKFARQKPEIQTVPSKSLASLPLQKDISSVSNEEVNHLMMYPHLQCNVVWGVTDITHLQLTTDFLPPTPSWWIKYSSAHTPTTSTTTTTSQDSSDTSTNILVDGAIGWSAFLV